MTTKEKKEALRPVPFKTWSPSALKDYEECPRKAMLDRSKKLCKLCFKGVMVKRRCVACGASEPPKGEALVRGEVIHEAAEMYIRGQLPKVSPDLKKVAPTLKALRDGYKKGRVRVELELAFTRAWKMTEWLAQDVYVRFKLDVLQLQDKKESVVRDWKTGRFKPEAMEEYADQLNGYAVATLTAGFGESVRSFLTFTDHGNDVPAPGENPRRIGELTLAKLPEAQSALDKRAARLLNVTQDFVPKAGRPCRYCAYSTNKGGPCQF